MTVWQGLEGDATFPATDGPAQPWLQNAQEMIRNRCSAGGSARCILSPAAAITLTEKTQVSSTSGTDPPVRQCGLGAADGTKRKAAQRAILFYCERMEAGGRGSCTHTNITD